MAEASHSSSPARVAAAAAIADVAVVAVFVAAGRRSHHEEGGWDAFVVAAPFLIALALGWLVSRAWRAPLAVATGMIVWVVTVAAGMVLRRLAFDRSTALAFVIVAAAFLLIIPGWRLVVTRRRDS